MPKICYVAMVSDGDIHFSSGELVLLADAGGGGLWRGLGSADICSRGCWGVQHLPISKRGAGCYTIKVIVALSTQVAIFGVSATSSTVVVYIQERVSWGLGFGVCVAANLSGFMVFMLGKQYYPYVKPKESPFASIARVVGAAIMKRNAARCNCYFYGTAELSRLNCGPTTDFSFLNNPALKPESNQSSDLLLDKRSWKLCTVEEVEDLKTLLKIIPLWSSTILLSATIGHIINIIDQVGSALVENKGLQVVKNLHLDGQQGSVVPMSAFWLVINLTIIGISEALHYPGQVAFYYQEFPESLRNTATVMISLIVGIGFYSSAVVIGLIRGATDWLPDDINEGRADYVYWIMSGIGMVNFAYYLIRAKFFYYGAAMKLSVHFNPYGN
ncbi:hypothetical protein AgCh_039833 [Apium graveolens]